MNNREKLINDLQNLPQNIMLEVYDFVQYLKQKEKSNTMLAAESSLKKDWLTEEEEDAWKSL